eukprot:5572445-Amphidinium_carterae.1
MILVKKIYGLGCSQAGVLKKRYRLEPDLVWRNGEGKGCFYDDASYVWTADACHPLEDEASEGHQSPGPWPSDSMKYKYESWLAVLSRIVIHPFGVLCLSV